VVLFKELTHDSHLKVYPKMAKMLHWSYGTDAAMWADRDIVWEIKDVSGDKLVLGFEMGEAE